MKTDKRKIVIVGTGMVGMSYAYCLLNQSVCNELVLIDVGNIRTARTQIWWSLQQEWPRNRGKPAWIF